MKIDLNTIDTTNFKLKEGLVNGRLVSLINPVEFNCNWTKDNLYLRSVLVDFDGQVLSRGFNKFFNFSESSNLYPNPDNYKDWVLTNKEDGSLMICDYIYDVLNVRTRGTISYKDHENTSDFEFVINKYNLLSTVSKYSEYSLLFEIYSPTNVIVLKPYAEPEIVFLGAINKDTGQYYPFYTDIGKEIQSFVGCNVPEIFVFENSSIFDVSNKITAWEGKEGVVLNFNNNQTQVKLKTNWYLLRHRMKSELSSLEKVIDFWNSLDRPKYQEFYDKVVATFDYEIAEIARPHISNICDGYKEVLKIIAHMKAFVEPLKSLSRKDAAITIVSSYGGESNNRAGFCFKILDGKELDSDAVKKLLFQVLKD